VVATPIFGKGSRLALRQGDGTWSAGECGRGKRTAAIGLSSVFCVRKV